MAMTAEIMQEPVNALQGDCMDTSERLSITESTVQSLGDTMKAIQTQMSQVTNSLLPQLEQANATIKLLTEKGQSNETGAESTLIDVKTTPYVYGGTPANSHSYTVKRKP